MTLSLAAVFIPVLFMGGIIGRLFKEFAVTIGVAVLISGFIALTLTPMLCSRFLRQKPKETPDGFHAKSEKAFEWMLRVYGRGLRWFLKHRLITLLFTILVLLATIHLFRILPKGFIPSEDTSQMMVTTEAVEGISFESLVEHQKTVASIVKADPNVAAFMSNAGARGPFGRGNAGSLFIRLKPRSERELGVDELITQFRPKLAQVPGMRVYLQNPPPLRIGGMVTRSLYQYTLQSPDLQELYEHAIQLQDKIKALPGLLDVTADLEIKNPQVTVEIDRDRAAVLGVTAEQIEDALYTAYGSRQISTIYAANDDYAVIMEIKPEHQREPAAMSLLYIRSAAGQLVPLDSFAKVTTSCRSGRDQSPGPAASGHHFL